MASFDLRLLRFARPSIGLLSIALVAAKSSSQESSTLTDTVDRFLARFAETTPGCAVAVSLDGERIVYAASGAANLETGEALTPETLFDAGSLVKQFVAGATLLLVEDGRIGLSDDVRKHVPELPDSGHHITVDHLLTHTSGVREWLALRNMSREDEDALTMVLRQRGLDFAPGEEWSYSNSGYVLLKELIARKSGMPFSEFVQNRIFDPLGMDATTYVADPTGRERLAIAYEKEGGTWTPDVLTGNERGGGGALLSTVGDLLVWNDAIENGRLGALVTKKLGERATLNNGRKLGYGRGLFFEDVPGRPVIWHTGSAGGYKSMLSRYPAHGVSIAVLSNAGDSMDRAELVGQILDLLAPASDGAGSVTTASADVAISAEVLANKPGVYFDEHGGWLRLVPRRGGLGIIGAPGLVSIAEDRFKIAVPSLRFRSEDECELRFTSDDSFELVSMEGHVTVFHRGEPDSLDDDDRAELVGNYESNELNCVLDVSSDAERLTIGINGSRSFELSPADLDTFQRGPVTVRFLRDDEGKVDGLAFSNPALRRVRFARGD